MNPTDDGKLSISQLAAACVTTSCHSSTPNISSVSLLTCTPPLPTHLPPDYEGFTLSERKYLKKKLGCGDCVDVGENVVPAVKLSTCSLADRRPWWEVVFLVLLFFFTKRRCQPFFFCSCLFFLTRTALTVVFCLRGRLGPKISSAGRRPC